jgi:hypothetical protein
MPQVEKLTEKKFLFYVLKTGKSKIEVLAFGVRLPSHCIITCRESRMWKL